MQPNAPMPTPILPPNPYEQILNSGTPQKKPFLFGNGGKPNKLVMALFILIVIVVLFVGYTIFTSLTAKNYDAIISLAQRQEEIIRVSELGLKKAGDQSTLTYVSTIRSVTQSEQNDTIAFLKKKGTKVTQATLALKKDADTDKTLKTAEQNNTYDEVLLGKLNDLLVSYHKSIKYVVDPGDSKSETSLLTSLKNNAKLVAGAEN